MPLSTLGIVPVIPSSDIQRDIMWYEEHVGFRHYFGDNGYCGIRRDNWEIHLQWHHNNDEDPILPGAIKIFVNNLDEYTREFLERKTITSERIRRDTPWGTHEFSFYDLNRNAIFFVEDKSP